MQVQALALLLLVVAASALVYTPSRRAVTMAQQFDEYTRFWNKTYSHVERAARFENFKMNAAKIAEGNAKTKARGYGARFGFTKFSDWSLREQQSLNGYVRSPDRQPKNVIEIEKRAEEQNPTKAIDWVKAGKTTPVKDQGQCGSCWAFSTTETVESAILMSGGSVHPPPPQDVVDCDQSDSGCNGGDPQEALGWVQQQGGLDTDSCYPYTAQDGSCASSQCTPAGNIKSVVPVGSDESTIYQSLQQYGPLSICCDASSWSNYQDGVLTADQCGDNVDHAIQLTGYSPDQGGYWIVRNSWGSDWGINGFIWLQYGQNTCDITDEVTAATA
jgi:C1A family cysteine protease